MRLADRVTRLGTETAFAVSAEAAAYAAAGNKVYPFHIGDMNLATPANIQEAAVGACTTARPATAPTAASRSCARRWPRRSRAPHGLRLGAENVAVQPGGKPVIEKFLLALVNPGDEVLYPNPGFPIYESQIEFQGATAVPYGFVPGPDNFLLDFDAIEAPSPRAPGRSSSTTCTTPPARSARAARSKRWRNSACARPLRP